MPQPIDVVEALLFASDSPLPADRICEVLDLADAAEARALVDALRERYVTADGALTVVEVGGGFRMVTRPEIAPWLMRLAKTRTKARLSRPSLETLAIVAYRQPVSRPEVDALRGVNSDAVLENLLERRLIRIAGRKEAPGRPFLYETTREFLIAFGLRDAGDLPKVEGELIVPTIELEPAADAPADPASDLAPDAATGEADVLDAAATATEGAPDVPDGESAAAEQAAAADEDALDRHEGVPAAPESAPEAPGGAPETPEDAPAALEDAPAASESEPGAPERADEAHEAPGSGPETHDGVAGERETLVRDGEAQAEQDPRPGGTDVAPRG